MGTVQGHYTVKLQSLVLSTMFSTYYKLFKDVKIIYLKNTFYQDSIRTRVKFFNRWLLSFIATYNSCDIISTRIMPNELPDNQCLLYAEIPL